MSRISVPSCWAPARGTNSPSASRPPPEAGDGASRLPPELRFIIETPDMEEWDHEERLKFMRGRSQKMRQHRDAFVALGWNPDASIAELEGLQSRLEAKHKEVEALEDTLLHAQADLADLHTGLAKTLTEAIAEESEKNPFNPQVQEWKEELEELRKHIPKEDGALGASKR